MGAGGKGERKPREKKGKKRGERGGLYFVSLIWNKKPHFKSIHRRRRRRRKKEKKRNKKGILAVSVHCQNQTAHTYENDRRNRTAPHVFSAASCPPFLTNPPPAAKSNNKKPHRYRPPAWPTQNTPTTHSTPTDSPYPASSPPSPRAPYPPHRPSRPWPRSRRPLWCRSACPWCL